MSENSASPLKKAIFILILAAVLLLALEILLQALPNYKMLKRVAAYKYMKKCGMLWAKRPGSGPAGCTPILFLGGSSTLGWGLAETSQSFPYLVEDELNRESDTECYRTVNAAAQGYTTFQALRFFEKYAKKHKPGIVVVDFGVNDAHPDYIAPTLLTDREYYHMINSLPEYRLTVQSWLAKSKVYALVKRSHFALVYVAVRKRHNPRVPPDEFVENLISLCEIGKEIGASMVFVGEPTRDPESSRAYREKMREAAIKTGAVWLDPQTEIFSDARKNPDYFIDGVHLTKEGHAMMAEYVSESLASIMRKEFKRKDAEDAK